MKPYLKSRNASEVNVPHLTVPINSKSKAKIIYNEKVKDEKSLSFWDALSAHQCKEFKNQVLNGRIQQS
jgi:hypothetical protein